MKAARQALIKEIIENQSIHTQEELADAYRRPVHTDGTADLQP